MFDNTVAVALIGGIVAISTTASPLFLAWLTNKQRRVEKREDYARQDEVANRLIIQQAKAVESAKVVNSKLDVIHTLVNSEKTASMQAEHDTTARTLVLLLEMVDLKRGENKDPSVAMLAEIEAAKVKIAELKASLLDRLRQSEIVAVQQDREKDRVARAIRSTVL